MVNGAAATKDDASSLRIHNLSKTHRSPDGSLLWVLEKVFLSIEPREFISLVGPSGCGKSSLLRLIAGLDVPGSGTLTAGEKPIAGPGQERGLVFQDPSLFPWLTVRKNVESGLIARGMLRQHKHEVDQLIQLVGLEAFAKSYPHQLSGGMAQRAALARALINHPQILLLDEPLGALDAFTRMRLQDELLRLWQSRGTTMLLVTHDIDEAIYISDRVLIMSPRPGRIEQEIPIALPRPRSRTAPAFLDLRTQILGALHLTQRA